VNCLVDAPVDETSMKLTHELFRFEAVQGPAPQTTLSLFKYPWLPRTDCPCTDHLAADPGTAVDVTGGSVSSHVDSRSASPGAPCKALPERVRLQIVEEVTRILNAIEQGESQAAEQLLPVVYEELRRLAEQKMLQEAPGQTLQPTALVHEAYLRLVEDAPAQLWNSRGHFFAAAAEAMRRILIESARQRQRVKHGGGRKRVDLDDACPLVLPVSDDLLALDEALSRLEKSDRTRAEVVKLRFFAGLTMPEIAQALGISLATAERYWKFARVWLYAELTADEEPPLA
jgi:RNA polymerase sigma factor (TIGR02999 family)